MGGQLPVTFQEVLLHDIKGNVPRDIACTFSVFHGFYYIARRETLIEDGLAQLQDVLRCFHRPASIFPY